MADSVYRVTELVGTSSVSWEAAAKSAVETASKSLRDLRVAEQFAVSLDADQGVAEFVARVGEPFLLKAVDPFQHFVGRRQLLPRLNRLVTRGFCAASLGLGATLLRFGV